MHYEGTAKLDKRTKNLVKRLTPGDIAIIDHEDLDQVTAETLVRSKVEVVINASPFLTGRYPNLGPLLLASAGVHLIDAVGPAVFDAVKEGQPLGVRGREIYRNGDLVAKGETLNVLDIKAKMDAAKEGLSLRLEEFAANTLEFIEKEREFFLEGMKLPPIVTSFAHRHALVVVRGYEYEADIQALRSYIREIKPVLVGVDGGADALMKEGYLPDLIIGDMDSVDDDTLKCGAELVVHAYPDGRAPGLKRTADLGLSASVWPAPGMSEDLALLLAYELGAELIVAVGTHANIIEFLDKGRKGMASTFLTRLKVGGKLVDAKGVNKLYRGTVKASHLVLLAMAAMATLAVILLSSASARALMRLAMLSLQSRLGI